MSESIELQRTIIAAKAGLKNASPLHPLAALCADIGLILEGVTPYFDNSIAPRELKLAVWDFALAAKRLREWVDDGKVPDAAIGGDYGDIGNQVKGSMASALTSLTDAATTLRVNLRELIEIGKKQVAQQEAVGQGESRNEISKKV